MIFALAARYEVPDASVEAESLTRVWTAGDEYLVQARELLYLYSIPLLLPSNLDSSTISCCHALVLMAYHGAVCNHIMGMLIVGNGAGWDLGLFGICGKDGAGFRSSS
jgi:hypothetical protein